MRMRLNIRIIILLVVSSAAVFAGEPQAQSWSAAVDGLRARLVIDSKEDFQGTVLPIVCLEIQNIADVSNAKRIWFGTRQPQFKWQVLDSKGNQVPESPTAFSIAEPPPYWITLPYDSILRFRVSVSGYGIIPNGGFALQLPGAFWQISEKEGEKYFLSATFSSSSPDENDRKEEWHGQIWKGILLLPKIEIPHRLLRVPQ